MVRVFIIGWVIMVLEVGTVFANGFEQDQSDLVLDVRSVENTPKTRIIAGPPSLHQIDTSTHLFHSRSEELPPLPLNRASIPDTKTIFEMFKRSWTERFLNLRI